MKRVLLTLTLLLALAAGAVLALRHRLTARLVDVGVARVTELAAGRGMSLREIQVGSSRMLGMAELAMERVKGEALLRRGLLNPGAEAIYFEAARVMVSALDLWHGRFLVTVSDGLIVMLDTAGQPTGQQISQLRAEVELKMAWRHLGDSTRLVEQELRHLVREGSFRLPARIEGRAQFQILGRWHNASLRSRAEQGVTSLELEEADVREIARAYTLPLTEAEITLVARNPVRAPALLRISRQAFAAAQALRRRDSSYPYDAYRHVYWSWLLTREFGPEFSEKVTDAHEIRPTYETSPASRRMDLHNNAVGRAYALSEVPERELVQRVLTDPNIVRRE